MSTTRIKALIGFSDGEISMYSGQIDNIDATKASAYISGGLAVEYTDPINPTGSLNITANGTYDVTDKANAVVNVAVKTVTYNVNGGTGSVDAVTVIAGNTINVNNGAGITPPTNKTFVGWATTSDATVPDVEATLQVLADVTLYAVYQTVAYTVTYNVNGGTGSVDAETVSVGQSVTLDDGAGITPPEGKEFSGWGESAAATETIESPYTPTADVTLYAVYVDSTQ